MKNVIHFSLGIITRQADALLDAVKAFQCSKYC